MASLSSSWIRQINRLDEPLVSPGLVTVQAQMPFSKKCRYIVWFQNSSNRFFRKRQAPVVAIEDHFISKSCTYSVPAG